MTLSSEEKRQLRQKKGKRKKRSDAAEIGALQEVENLERRLACTGPGTCRLFLETYFPGIYYADWGQVQLEVITDLEEVLLSGGNKAVAMPRGEGKTSICEGACLWSVMTGLRDFVMLIGATGRDAKINVSNIKTSLETNERLKNDFPEIVIPIRALEGKVQRCASQTQAGHRTRMTYTSKQLIFPTISEESLEKANVPLDANGCMSIFKAAGITAASRGAQANTADGRKIRPDVVVIDDPQTDKSASSDKRTDDRIGIISSLTQSSGPTKAISAVMPCTVIREGDLADYFTDTEENPHWNGTREGRILEFPENDDLWDEYADILWAAHQNREPGMSDADVIRPATKFYRENRDEMEEGAKVSWEVAYDEEAGEITALQHAMNVKILNEEMFWNELQNNPQSDADSEAEFDRVPPKEIVAKINRRKKGRVPGDHQTLVTYIDCHKKLLWWVSMSFEGEDGWTGSVVNYGTYPDQSRVKFTMRAAKRTIRRVHQGLSVEGALYQALDALVDDIVERQWIRTDGSVQNLTEIGIDQGWKTDVVHNFIEQSKHRNLLIPCRGRGIKARNRPMSEYDLSRIREMSFHCYVPKTKRRETPHLEIDTNFYKTFVHDRLRQPLGDDGNLSLFGKRPGTHWLLADHLNNEDAVNVEVEGREVTEWYEKDNKPDQHWLDCVAGCFALAAKNGVGSGSIMGGSKKKQPKKRRRRRVTQLSM